MVGRARKQESQPGVDRRNNGSRYNNNRYCFNDNSYYFSKNGYYCVETIWEKSDGSAS